MRFRLCLVQCFLMSPLYQVCKDKENNLKYEDIKIQMLRQGGGRGTQREWNRERKIERDGERKRQTNRQRWREMDRETE